MKPIISPWWIYVYGLVDNTKTVFEIGVFIFAVALIVIVAGAFIYIDGRMPAMLQKFSSYWKRLLAALIANVVIMIAIPSQDTLIYMQIARFSSTGNLESVVESAKEAVDYVVETVQSLKGDMS